MTVNTLTGEREREKEREPCVAMSQLVDVERLRVGRGCSPHDDGKVILLRHGHGDTAASSQCSEEDFIGDDIELLLIIA